MARTVEHVESAAGIQSLISSIRKKALSLAPRKRHETRGASADATACKTTLPGARATGEDVFEPCAPKEAQNARRVGGRDGVQDDLRGSLTFRSAGP